MSGNLSQKDKSASKLSHELNLFADSLKPSDQYIYEGKQLVQAVFGRFQKEDRFSVDRPYIGGSVGKNTSVIYPDYDCVIFLNNKFPPMKQTVLEFVELVKKEAKTLKIEPESIRNSSITAQMRFQNGTELDLLPAVNFSQDKDKQYEEVLRRIRENPSLLSEYSSSLAQIVIEFLNKQEGVTHQLIRLGKYWFKSLTLDEYIYGGSTMIEIICVAAAYETIDAGNGYYTTRAFRKFFEKVQNIDKLKIAFFRENNEWKLVPEKDLVQKKYKKYYSSEILQKPNFIIEPANPFNNLAQNLKQGVIDKLKYFAGIMIRRLDDLEKSESSEMKTLQVDRVVIHFEKFFEPFPIRLRGAYSPVAIPVYLLIQYDYRNHETAHCRTEEINKAFFNKRENSEARKAIKALRNNLLFLIRAKAMKNEKNLLQFTNGLAEMASIKDVKDSMQIIIQQNFGIQKFIKESSKNEEHQKFDVTLYVPYRCSNCTYAVRLSLKWKH